MSNENDWDTYREIIAKEFFKVCDNKNVLEIAPFNGHQTQAITTYNLNSLTLVEPNSEVENVLIKKFPTATVIVDDIFNFYQNKFPVDIVVACGLLYHLHSPLHLLELIANQSDPDYIILDCTSHNNININVELPNQPGNRYTIGDWKSVNYYIAIPFDYIDSSLNHLGYTCIKHRMLADMNISSKKTSWMASWKKDS